MVQVPIRSARDPMPGRPRCLHSNLARFHWNCPTCGWHMVAYWTERVDAGAIAHHPRCGVCVQQGRVWGSAVDERGEDDYD